MSPALPVLSGAQVVAALAKAGFVQVSQKGSHVKLRTGERVAIVPMHREDDKTICHETFDPFAVHDDSFVV